MCPWPSSCFHGPSSKFLDLLPPASLPPVQKRDAQHMFLQHKGAHTVATERGAGEKRLESTGRTAGSSAGKKRSAGSSAALFCRRSNSTPPSTPLFPGTVPGNPLSTLQAFLSSTPFWGQRLRKLTIHFEIITKFKRCFTWCPRRGVNS